MSMREMGEVLYPNSKLSDNLRSRTRSTFNSESL